MNRSILIRRLRGPAFVVLLGIMALLSQADILHWGQSWPLLLILAGVLGLAERIALSADGGYPQTAFPSAAPGAPTPWSGAQYPGAHYSAQAAAANAPASAAPAQPGTAMVPAPPQSLEKYTEGGQS